MNWTWYLACEVQFFVLVPFLVQAYMHKRNHFWIAIVSVWFLSALTQFVVIIRNSFSASYFTYKDEYWSIYYEKPFVRLPCYLLGVVWGCTYYSFKHEKAG